MLKNLKYYTTMKVIIVLNFNFVHVIPRFVLSAALFPLSMMLTLILFSIIIIIISFLLLMCLNRKWKIVTNRKERGKKGGIFIFFIQLYFSYCYCCLGKQKSCYLMFIAMIQFTFVSLFDIKLVLYSATKENQFYLNS